MHGKIHIPAETGLSCLCGNWQCFRGVQTGVPRVTEWADSAVWTAGAKMLALSHVSERVEALQTEIRERHEETCCTAQRGVGYCVRSRATHGDVSSGHRKGSGHVLKTSYPGQRREYQGACRIATRSRLSRG